MKKKTASERFAQHYSRPLENGTGLAPRWSQEHYKGIPITDNVRERMEYYASLPSLEETRHWVAGGK